MTTEEFPRLREPVKLDACLKAYLRLQRTGSRFTLDRRKKMEIAEIYHKAGEHAYYGYCVALGSQRAEGSTAEELREFAGQILDRTRITRH